MSLTSCIKCGNAVPWNPSIGGYICKECGHKHETKVKEPEDKIEKAQERKETFINKSLDKKNTAIEIAGAKRDACMIVTAMINQGIYRPYYHKDDKVLMSGEDATEEVMFEIIQSELEKWARYWLNFDPSEKPEEIINTNKANF